MQVYVDASYSSRVVRRCRKVALFVIERDARARLRVANFQTVTAEMQAEIDRAGGDGQ